MRDLDVPPMLGLKNPGSPIPQHIILSRSGHFYLHSPHLLVCQIQAVFVKLDMHCVADQDKQLAAQKKRGNLPTG
jgi:hypothetical protein